jgi:hypothetical protein
MPTNYRPLTAFDPRERFIRAQRNTVKIQLKVFIYINISKISQAMKKRI